MHPSIAAPFIPNAANAIVAPTPLIPPLRQLTQRSSNSTSSCLDVPVQVDIFTHVNFYVSAGLSWPSFLRPRSRTIQELSTHVLATAASPDVLPKTAVGCEDLPPSYRSVPVPQAPPVIASSEGDVSASDAITCSKVNVDDEVLVLSETSPVIASSDGDVTVSDAVTASKVDVRNEVPGLPMIEFPADNVTGMPGGFSLIEDTKDVERGGDGIDAPGDDKETGGTVFEMVLGWCGRLLRRVVGHWRALRESSKGWQWSGGCPV